MPELPVIDRIKAALEKKIAEMELTEVLKPYMNGFLEGIIQHDDDLDTTLYNLGATLAEYLQDGARAIDDFEATRIEAILEYPDDGTNSDEHRILKMLAEIEISLVSEGIFAEDFIKAIWQ